MMMMELFDSFPPQFSEDPLKILVDINSFERDEVINAQRKVGCMEIVPGLRWLHWEIRSAKSSNRNENNILQLSEIMSDQPSVACKICLKLGDTDVVSIYAEGKHGVSTSGTKLLQIKICLITSDNKVHNVTLEVEDTSISFLSPLLALCSRDNYAVLDVNKLNRRFVSSNAGVHSSVSWYWAKLQMVPNGRTITCAAWLSSSHLLLGLSEGGLISVVIIGESCTLQEFYIKDTRSGVQSLWNLLSIGIGGGASNLPALTTDKPTDIIAVSAARDPNLPAGAYLAMSINRLGQLHLETVQYTQDNSIASAAGHCQHNCLVQADLTDIASAAQCSLFAHLDAHSYKLGKPIQAFQLGKDRLLSGGILRATLQRKDHSTYELALAIAVEMNEFAEDESLLLFGEISGRKVWQILVASCTLQWPSGGAAATVRDGLCLKAAPFRLPSDPTAGLLDVQLVISPVDQSSYSVFSAWKSRDGSPSGGADNELVISKWTLPSTTVGVTTEWRSSERRQRRLQDDVILQQLRDFLRNAENITFTDKEDTVKAEMLRRIFLPHRFLDITILRSCHQMIHNIDRLQQSKSSRGGLYESKSSGKSKAAIRWKSSLTRAISGLPHENLHDSAAVTKEYILEQLAEAVTEACECLASLQAEDGSIMGHVGEQGYLDFLANSFGYLIQLCEGAQSDTDGLGSGSFIISTPGQSFIQGAIAKSDRRISFLIDGGNENNNPSALDAALSLLESTIEPRTLMRVADSTLQSLLLLSTTGPQKVDVINSIKQIYSEGFGGKLDLVVSRLQEIIRRSSIRDNPIWSFIKTLNKDLDSAIQGATIQVEMPSVNSAASLVPLSKSLRDQVVAELCIRKIEQSLHRTQLSLILLIVLVHSHDSALFFASDGGFFPIESTVNGTVIPQLVLKLLQLSFLVHTSTVRLAIPMDSALDDSFPLSVVLRTHSKNGFEVYDTDLSVLDNFVLSDRDLFGVQSASLCVDRLLNASSVSSLTRFLLQSGQYSLLKVWTYLLQRQVDLAGSFLPTSAELEILSPRLDLSQQVDLTLADDSSILSASTLEALNVIVRQHLLTVRSMAEIHELQQELTSVPGKGAVYHQSDDSIFQLKKDIMQMLPPLPTDPSELDALQLQFQQLVNALTNGNRAAASRSAASLDYSNTTVNLTWCDDQKRMNALKNFVLDSLVLATDSLNAAAHKPTTAVVMQHFWTNGNGSSFVHFYPNFIAGLPVFTHLLRIYLVEDLTVAVEMLPQTAASDDLAIELYGYLVGMIDFSLDSSVADIQEEDFFARAIQAVADYADGKAQDLSIVFCGYLILELLKAMYSLFECLLRRGGLFNRALDVLKRIADIEKNIRSHSIGEVRIPSTAASSAHFGKVERCLRALVDSAVDNGQLEWLCKLTQPEPHNLNGNTESFLDIIEDQLQLLANRCDVAVFLPQKQQKEITATTNYFEYLLVFLLHRRKFRTASRFIFSCYEKLTADTDAGSLESTAVCAIICKSLLATSIHALGLLPQDQAFIHIHSVQNSGGQRMEDDSPTAVRGEVMLVDPTILSFLFSLSSAVETVLYLYTKRMLEDSLSHSELLHEINSGSVCENMVAILSRAGRLNLAVSLASEVTNLVKVADSGNISRFLKVRGIALSRLGSLSLFEVAVLSSVRTLNFFSVQLQDSGCLHYDMETIVSDMTMYGTIFPESSIDGFESDLRGLKHYFEAFSWRQMLRWCNVHKSDRLFCMSLGCVLQLDPTQPIPAYVIEFPKQNSDTLYAVLTLFTRYKRLTEACGIAAKLFEPSNGGGKDRLWLSLGTVDSLIEVTEKEVELRGQLDNQDEAMVLSLQNLKDSIVSHLKDLAIQEM